MIEGGHQTEPMGITPDLSAWWNYNPSPAIFFTLYVLTPVLPGNPLTLSLLSVVHPRCTTLTPLHVFFCHNGLYFSLIITQPSEASYREPIIFSHEVQHSHQCHVF